MDLLNNLYYLLEYAAIDGGEGDDGTSTDVDTTPEDTETQGEATTDVAEPTDEVQKFEIDGEEVDYETLKEWKQGHLRQSDYTRKTQQIAQMRKELEKKEQENQDALEIYQFLQANPDVAQMLYESSDGTRQKPPSIQQQPATDPRVEQVIYELELQKLETTLNNLKQKDPNLNDVDILNIANEQGVDIETAYTIWRGQNFDKILQDEVKKKQEELVKRLKENKESTSTLITPGDKGVSKGLGLTEYEMQMAQKLDMTVEDYAKWKNYNPNR